MVYMQFLCSDYVTDDNFKNNFVGYVMMIIFSLNIVVNIVVGFVELFKPYFLRLKRWRYQRANKRTVRAQSRKSEEKSKKNPVKTAAPFADTTAQTNQNN